MRRLAIRTRLTAAFALTMLLVLAAAGAFVYVQLRADLDEAVDAALDGRAEAADALLLRGRGAFIEAAEPLEDPEESFVQVLDADGRVLAAAGGATEPALSAREVRPAWDEPLVVERVVPGIEGEARMLARPTAAPEPGEAGPPRRSGGTRAANGSSPRVVVAGQSLEDRNETLSGVVASFAVGGPLAVVVASVIGYALATASLAPVEAMRQRAREVSLSGGDDRLPLPHARDEVRRLGETLNEMLARLQRSFDRERRFVGNASHELRTPVAVLKTELEGALRRGGHEPEVRESLVAAVEECDHLVQLADDLLVVARAGEGELPLRPETLDARLALEQVQRRFADRASERGRAIRTEAEAGLSLYADPGGLRQALGNLVDNALRHGAGDLVLSAHPNGKDVELEVADQGPGFESAIAGRAFERFARGEVTGVRRGSGLGLAIVKAIAEAHGGSAEIVPGTGGRVRVSLPGRPAGGDGDSADP